MGEGEAAERTELAGDSLVRSLSEQRSNERASNSKKKEREQLGDVWKEGWMMVGDTTRHR